MDIESYHLLLHSQKKNLRIYLNQWSNCATYPSAGGRSKKKGHVFQKGEHTGVATNVYLRKLLEKPKTGLRILKIRVHELFTRREGISTPRARHKGWQPQIMCATWLQKLFIFPLFISLYFFWVQQGGALAPTYPQVQWGIQTYVVL